MLRFQSWGGGMGFEPSILTVDTFERGYMVGTSIPVEIAGFAP